MTPIGAMSQLTPCVHKGLAMGTLRTPWTPGFRVPAGPTRGGSPRPPLRCADG